MKKILCTILTVFVLMICFSLKNVHADGKDSDDKMRLTIINEITEHTYRYEFHEPNNDDNYIIFDVIIPAGTFSFSSTGAVINRTFSVYTSYISGNNSSVNLTSVTYTKSGAYLKVTWSARIIINGGVYVHNVSKYISYTPVS